MVKRRSSDPSAWQRICSFFHISTCFSWCSHLTFHWEDGQWPEKCAERESVIHWAQKQITTTTNCRKQAATAAAQSSGPASSHRPQKSRKSCISFFPSINPWTVGTFYPQSKHTTISLIKKSFECYCLQLLTLGSPHVPWFYELFGEYQADTDWDMADRSLWAYKREDKDGAGPARKQWGQVLQFRIV